MLDLLTHRFSVAIAAADGSNSLDVTALVESFVVSDRHLDESGLIQTTGRLVLNAYPFTPFSESLNPNQNRSRWARGNRVEVRVSNAAGTLVTHPRGALRILKKPNRPHRGNPQLEIEVGCDLALLDYRNPPGDDSEVQLGQETARHTIINKLATKAGLPHLVEQIQEWKINYPLFRLDGGYVAQMGAIAYAAGYVLWMDNQRRLRAKTIDLEPSAEFDLTVGVDDSVYEPLDSSETPCELIICTGTTQEVKQAIDPDPQIVLSRGTEFSVFGEGDDDVPNVIAEKVTIYYYSMASTTPTVLRLIQKPKGVLMPDVYPSDPELLSIDETNTDYFDDEETGYLLRRISSTIQPLGVTQPDLFPGDLSQLSATETITDYTYEDDVTVAITTTTREQQGVIKPDPDNINATILTTASRTTQRWQKTNQGWQQSTSTISYKGGGSNSSTSYSTSGNNQPPAPERRQQENYGEEKQLKAQARFLPAAEAEYAEREREYQISTAISNAQLREVAKTIGTILHGRDEGITWAMDLRDRWLDYEPLMAIDWTDDEGFKSRYLADGVTFSLTADSTAVAGDGIKLL
jgi:hypothetical protein